tara:strand:+ start:273 stop:1055 length:783 start_codon:yes stop_codon:yes gene_type:complete
MGKSHFPIDLGILTAIRQLVAKESTIVELGSGNGTNRLVKEYEVYSIEDDKKWIGYCEGTNYIHAPLKDYEFNDEIISWYDREIISKYIPQNYDLILVDGPSGKKGRDGLLANLDLFRTDIPFVIDDTLRNHECQIAREMAFLLNRPLYVFWNFSIIPSHSLSQEKIANIQKAALKVLDEEDEKYLKNYFSIPTELLKKDFDSLDEIILTGKKNKLERIRLEAGRRRLKKIENSFSLKLGRFLTTPFRWIFKLFNRKKKV